MTRPGSSSMIGPAVFGGAISTVFVASSFIGQNVEVVEDWCVATQDGHVFTPGNSACQGGIRVLDFGLPAYQASLFCEIALGGDGVDNEDLVVNLAGLLAHLGCNGFVGDTGMPIGHASITNDGVNTPMLHVVHGDSLHELVLLKPDGSRFDTKVIGGAQLGMQLDVQITND